MVKAEDLKCGNVFVFRDKTYVCMSCATDTRTTLTIVTCVETILHIGSEVYDIDWKNVVGLRLVRCLQVEVVDTVEGMAIVVIDDTEEEFNQAVEAGSFEQSER